MDPVRQIVRDKRNQTSLRKEREVLHPAVIVNLSQRTQYIEFKNLEKAQS
jgi:hypothetical protein